MNTSEFFTTKNSLFVCAEETKGTTYSAGESSMSSLHEQAMQNRKKRFDRGNKPTRSARVECVVNTTKVVGGKKVVTSAVVRVAKSAVVG